MGFYFVDPETYNNAANLQDNILFGKVAYGQAQGTSARWKWIPRPG